MDKKQKNVKKAALESGAVRNKTFDLAILELVNSFTGLVPFLAFSRTTIEHLLECIIGYQDNYERVTEFIVTCDKLARIENPKFDDSWLSSANNVLKRLCNCIYNQYYYGIGNDISELQMDYPIEFREMIVGCLKTTVGYLRSMVKSEDFYCKKEFDELVALFSLTPVERKFLEAIYLAEFESTPLIGSLDPGLQYNANIFAKYLGISLPEFNDMKKGRLLSFSLITVSTYDKITAGHTLSVILSQGIEKSKALFFEVPEPETLPLSCHLVEAKATDYIKQLLTAPTEEPTHILLWGTPGTGKSSYAKALLESLNFQPLLVKHGNMESNKKTETPEMSIYTSLEVALSSPENDKSICIVDDADDILGTSALFFSSGESRNRVWLHKLLERANTKIIWIVNNTRDINNSVKRRFSFNLFFPPLTFDQKKTMWKNVLDLHGAKSFITTTELNDWIKRYDFSAGVISKNIRSITESGTTKKRDFVSKLELALESYKKLHKNTDIETRIQRGSANFIETIGISSNIPELLEDLCRFEEYLKSMNKKDQLDIRNRSLLFHGVPGSGKSELAKYIAEKLNKPLIRKLASDILSMWVGGTEQNIRDAYLEAEQKEGILFIDEADSLLFDRGGAQRSWEVTQVNELLARMEDYIGIQIFATNRMTELDSASVRRFSHKIEFTYLKPEQAIHFYTQFFGKTPTNAEKKLLSSVCNLVPSDFKTVKDKIFFKKDVSNKKIIEELLAESKAKTAHEGAKCIGFDTK